MEVDGADVQGRVGGMVLRRTREVLTCPNRRHMLGTNGYRKSGATG